MAQSQTGRGSDGLNLDSASSGSGLESLLNHLNAIIQHPASSIKAGASHRQVFEEHSSPFRLRRGKTTEDRPANGTTAAPASAASPYSVCCPMTCWRFLSGARDAPHVCSGDPGTRTFWAAAAHSAASAFRQEACSMSDYSPPTSSSDDRMAGLLHDAPDQLAMLQLQASNGRP